MTQKRTWTERQRSVEECLQVLRSADERTLQRRAERLSMLVSIQTYPEYQMPRRTDSLLSEASDCFINGQYTGCILSLATGVEHGLRDLLGMQDDSSLDVLIKESVARGVVSYGQAEVLKALREYRNHAAHSHIDDLATGKTLQRQMLIMTEHGVMSGPVWEEFQPESQDDKETAADLSAEGKVREHLVNIREVVHDIFDADPNWLEW